MQVPVAGPPPHKKQRLLEPAQAKADVSGQSSLKKHRLDEPAPAAEADVSGQPSLEKQHFHQPAPAAEASVGEEAADMQGHVKKEKRKKKRRRSVAARCNDGEGDAGAEEQHVADDEQGASGAAHPAQLALMPDASVAAHHAQLALLSGDSVAAHSMPAPSLQLSGGVSDGSPPSAKVMSSEGLGERHHITSNRVSRLCFPTQEMMASRFCRVGEPMFGMTTSLTSLLRPSQSSLSQPTRSVQ